VTTTVVTMSTPAVEAARERVDVFIDGLNVYQGMNQRGLRDALWLDYRALAELILKPHQRLGKVIYFTARRTVPPASYARQQQYLRALDARGGVECVEGTFDRRKAPCVHCGRMTEMPRERATDVQLASMMVARAAHDEYDLALLVSGDDDYLLPVREVQRLGKRVKVARPPERRSGRLAEYADHMMDLGARHFRRSQLPDPVMPSRGSPIDCPFEWLPIEQKISRLPGGQAETLKAALEALGATHRNHLHALADQFHAAAQVR
jgi:uncharacterized LabA/DUF88 family protein